MTVDRFSLNAELFPFLSGEVRIVEMGMLEPRVNLQVEKNGTIAWTSPDVNLFNPEQINIESLVIENGSILIDGLAGDRTLELAAINGEVSAQTILGPWRIMADAEVEGVPAKIDMSTGSFRSEDKSMRVRMDAVRSQLPYRLIVDGPVKLKDDVLSWDGEFEVLPLSSSSNLPFSMPHPPLPVSVSGKYLASPEFIDVSEYRMEVGDPADPYIISGLGQLYFRDRLYFRANADGRQINLDRIGGQSEAGVTLESRIATLQSIIDRIPVPDGEGEINVRLPAVVAGDTLVREVQAEVRPVGNGWDLRNFTAVFPGNTVIEADGRLGVGEEFGFSGAILLASRQPSGFAAWLSGNVDAQIRRLKVLGLSSNITLSRNQALLDDLELRLDDAVLRGKLQRLAPADSRPALIAELGGNRINLQDLQALFSLTRVSDAPELASHDLDVRFTSDIFETRLNDVPVTASNLDAQIRIKDNGVSVEKLNAGDFYGATITSVGRLERVLENPHGNLKLKIDAEQASELLSFLASIGVKHPLLDGLMADASLTADTSLELEVDTRSQQQGANGRVLVSGVVGGSSVNTTIGFAGIPAEPEKMSLDIDLALSNNKPEQLARQFLVETLPSALVGELKGPAKAKLLLEGKPSNGFETRGSLSVDDTHLAFEGTTSIHGDGELDADVKATLGSQDIAPFLIVTGSRLPGISPDRKLPVSLKFDLDKKKGVAKFQSLTGQVGGNLVSGDVQYRYGEIKRPRISGQMKFGTLSLPLLTSGVFGFEESIVGGLVTDPLEQAFMPRLFIGYDANLTLEAAVLHTGTDLKGQNASARFVMLDGNMDINDLSFDGLGTRVKADVSLQQVDGMVVGELRYDLAEANLEALLAITGMPEIARGKVTMNGSSQATGRTVNGMLAAMSGNGIVDLMELVVDGITPDAFDAILSIADADGFKIDPAVIAEIAEENILSGSFDIGQLDFPFSISRGLARVRNLVIRDDRSQVSSDFEFALATRALNAKTTLLFEPVQREQIEGADPIVEFSWEGKPQSLTLNTETGLLEGYLSLRAFDAAQRRVETLEARVIEKQRLQREIAYNFAREQFALRQAEQERLRLEEEARLKAEEEARLKAEEEARKAAEQSRLQAEEEERQRQEAERLEAERKAEQARLQAEEEERQRQESERLEAEERAREQELARQREAAAQKAAEAALERRRDTNRSGQHPEPAQVSPLFQNGILKDLEDFLNPN